MPWCQLKMHQPNCVSRPGSAQTHCGSSQRSPRPPQRDLRGSTFQRKGKCAQFCIQIWGIEAPKVDRHSCGVRGYPPVFVALCTGGLTQIRVGHAPHSLIRLLWRVLFCTVLLTDWVFVQLDRPLTLSFVGGPMSTTWCPLSVINDAWAHTYHMYSIVGQYLGYTF